MTSYISRPQGGFTLTELTIVLVIVALLIGGMLVPLSAQRDIQNTNETQRQLTSINEALFGFVAGQGRLPCPATPASKGQESFCTNPTKSEDCGVELFIEQAHGRCTDFFNGFVPAATLGVSPTNSQGFAIDAWGNRLRYAVSDKSAGAIDFPFTKPSGIKSVWAVSPIPLQSNLLRICNTSENIAANDCPAADRITDSAVAVMLSTGKNGGVMPISSDELANWTNSNDRVFVSTTPSATYDDLVTWISPNILYNRMISAGRLP